MCRLPFIDVSAVRFSHARHDGKERSAKKRWPQREKLRHTPAGGCWALIPDGRKDFVRKVSERSTGRKGVLKHLSRNNRRFYGEAVNVKRLNGTRGILPVWDMDDTEQGKPRWYAMPQARQLLDELGDDATLREVVSAIAVLADVLARLAEEGTYHRDIKPDNLFWWDGGPVLADFGIAAWRTPHAGCARPRRWSHPPQRETRPGQLHRPRDALGPSRRRAASAPMSTRWPRPCLS